MGAPDFALIIDGVPACLLDGKGEPVCSLQAWAQTLGVPVVSTEAGFWLDGHRLRGRVYWRRGQVFVPVRDLARLAQLTVRIEPRSRRVYLFTPAGSATRGRRSCRTSRKARRGSRGLDRHPSRVSRPKSSRVRQKFLTLSPIANRCSRV